MIHFTIPITFHCSRYKCSVSSTSSVMLSLIWFGSTVFMVRGLLFSWLLLLRYHQ